MFNAAVMEDRTVLRLGCGSPVPAATMARVVFEFDGFSRVGARFEAPSGPVGVKESWSAPFVDCHCGVGLGSWIESGKLGWITPNFVRSLRPINIRPSSDEVTNTLVCMVEPW